MKNGRFELNCFVITAFQEYLPEENQRANGMKNKVILPDDEIR